MNFFLNRSRNRILIILLFLTASLTLWSNGKQPQSFLEELSSTLENEGWTEEEINEITRQDVDWGKVNEANSQIVALSLMLAKKEGIENGNDILKPMEKAMLAVEIANTSTEMEKLGFGEMSAALASMEGTRMLLTQMRSRDSQNVSKEELGEIIRTRMQQQITTMTRGRVQNQNGEMSQRGQNSGTTTDDRSNRRVDTDNSSPIE